MQSYVSLTVTASKPLAGEILLPGDKSLSHRAALFAALAEGTSSINQFLVSGVTRAMLNALTALGVVWRLEGAQLTVFGKGLRGLTPPCQPIICGNSATTLRMLAGALSATGTPCLLDGSEGLRKRPMNRITDPLQAMQVPITTATGCAPLTLAARDADTALQALHYTLPVASAQIKSCLILAALAANGPSTLQEPGPSRDHTERMLGSMGAKIHTTPPHIVHISPLTQPLTPLKISLPGDISSAAFLLVAAAIVPGSSILLRDVGLNPTRTGILDVLAEMGAQIAIENRHITGGEPVGNIRLTAAPLQAICIQGDTVVRMIDEFPALAIAACFATGTTTIRDAEELRYKETDRIAVLCHELRKLGVQLEEQKDGFSIQGGTFQGGVCEAHGDHRLAMSLAIAGLAAPMAVTVQHAEILHESFPDFTNQLAILGARIQTS